MKKLLYMAVALMVSMASVATFTACGDDDDDEVEDLIDAVTNGSSNGSIVEKGNTLTLTVEQSGVYTSSYVAKFDDNDMCTSYIQTSVYKSSSMAQTIYDAYSDGNGKNGFTVSRDGNTITIDYTEMYKGTSKAAIKESFQVLANGYN